MRPRARVALFVPSLIVLLAMACGAPSVAPMTPEVPVAPEADAAPEASIAPSTTTHVEADAGLGTKLEPKKGEPGRSREDIGAAVQARRSIARGCYDNAANKDPKLEGDVNVKWVIDPGGVVTEVTIDPEFTNMSDEAINKCIIAMIKTLRFPASAKRLQTNAEYRFNFKRNLEQMRAARDAGIL